MSPRLAATRAAVPAAGRRAAPRLAWAAALALAALTARCGGKAAAPVAPRPQPPAVEAVFPAARATRIQPETPIWARFREPLDPASVNDRNVFLKLDTGRIACDVAWDEAARSIRIVPREVLRLRRTYTVELTPRLATAAGATLDSLWFWQFTITSLRRLEHPWPADGAPAQSPFVAFGWDTTESDAGRVAYSVWLGTDSAAVADGAVTPRSTARAFLPAAAPLAFATDHWWRVGSRNLDTGEEATGPVWRFATVAVDAAIDSLRVPAASHGSPSSQRPTSPNCTAFTMTIGPTNNACIRWRLESVPRDLRLAGARLVVWPGLSSNVVQPVLFGTTADFDGCQARYTGPPFRDAAGGVLAFGVRVPAGPLYFVGDPLTARLQSAVSFGAPHGYAFAAGSTFPVFSPLADASRPTLTLYYYRDPPPLPGAIARREPPARR
jgi:hypothetical protein